jgi:hypothetical protein
MEEAEVPVVVLPEQVLPERAPQVREIMAVWDNL